MKKIVSLFSISLLIASSVVADEMTDVFNALAHDSQSTSSAGVKISTVLVPTFAVQYANGANTNDNLVALELLLVDLLGQAAYREVADRDDSVATAIQVLTNRWTVAAITATTMLILKKIKSDACTLDIATKIAITPQLIAVILQKVDRYLNEEAYAKNKIAKKKALK